MFNKPLLSNLSEKIYDIALISLVILMYITMCAEADMYVPAFPQMIDYFGVAENKIQLILSINFLGLSITGLVVGPLSDAYGRRSVLLMGLLLLVVSSYGCVQSESFSVMLFWRLLQGIAASIPMVVGAATFFDKYSAEKAGQLIGIANSVITAAMAGAPIIGAFISELFDWRANFIVILILAVLSFLGTLLCIGETLPKSKRKRFHLGGIFRDYGTLSKSFRFMGYSFIVNFPFNSIVIYIASLSVICINYLGLSLEKFSFYQATTMGTFIIFSLFSIKLISKKGLDYTKNLGGMLAIIGAIGLLVISIIDHTSINFICLSMAFIAAGGACMAGTFSVKALEVFPEMKGTSLGMMTAIRQLFAAGFVGLSEFLFDGTIVPIAQIIFGYALVSILIFAGIRFSERKKNRLC